MKSFGNGILLIVISWLLCTCSNDLPIVYQTPYKPVVYSILDPCDSFCYVTLSKSFSVREDVTHALKGNTKLGIDDAIITLEAWGDGYKLWETGFTRYNNMVTSPKTFEPGRSCYRSNKMLLFVDPAYEDTRKKWQYDYFRLYIYYPGFDLPSYCRIPSIKGPLVSYPRSGMNLNLYGSDQSYFQFELDLSEAKYADFICFFYFNEYTDHWTKSKVSFIVKKNMVLIDEYPIIRLYEEAFFNKLVRSFEQESPVDTRIFDHMEFKFTISDEYFHDYVTTYQNVSDSDIRKYSNILNAYGIFAMKREVTIPDILFDRQTLDSICYGRYTKHLNFLHW